MTKIKFYCLPFFLLMSNLCFSNILNIPKKHKLIVVLIIDQFRADYLTRFRDHFLPKKNKSGILGGFNYLIANGAYYPYAQYDILQSMTGPGHSTLLSGSYPYQTGIPLNDWYDSLKKKNMYCMYN